MEVLIMNMQKFDEIFNIFAKTIREDEAILLAKKGWNKKIKEICLREFPEIADFIDFSETRRICRDGNYSLRFMIEERLITGDPEDMIAWREVFLF